MIYPKRENLFLIAILGFLAFVVFISFVNYKNKMTLALSEDPNDEKACALVGSRGIMKTCDFFPLKPISSTSLVPSYNWDAINNFSGFSNDGRRIPTVYVNTSAVKNFPTFLENCIHTKIILVSGDADETVYEDVFGDEKKFIDFIENPKIHHWFSQNATIQHPKLSQIPIGLDYHTLDGNGKHWWGECARPTVQEEELFKIRMNSLPISQREFKIYVNFNFQMDTKYGYDRKEALKIISSLPEEYVFIEKSRKKRHESWVTQSKFKLVASPFGNGYDCHRTWEAIALGCVPIVRSSGLDSLYSGLPVLLVKEWKDLLDVDFLKNELEKIIANMKSFVHFDDKMTLKFWRDEILSYTNIKH